MRDLGLSYEQAAHGVQSAIAHEMNLPTKSKATDPKHMRVGIDMSKADQLGLVELLIAKGVFTAEEYIEYMRLSANEELAMRNDEHAPISFR
jgi:hypothetical protein